MNNEKILKEVKEKMKEHPVIKETLDKMIADGIDEDVALNLMLYTYFKRMGAME